MERVWVGRRLATWASAIPNTGIAAAWVLGAGGAAHQQEISGTLMKGDEVSGSGVFQVRLYAGLDRRAGRRRRDRRAAALWPTT